MEGFPWKMGIRLFAIIWAAAFDDVDPIQHGEDRGQTPRRRLIPLPLTRS